MIEGSDENTSFSAQQYRNDLASALSGIAQEDFSCDPLTGKPQPVPKTGNFGDGSTDYISCRGRFDS